jgi:hypothetical protein
MVGLMVCLRCGYCCFGYDVIIVDPKVITKTFKLHSDLSEELIHKPCNQFCPHQTWDKDTSICKLHQFKWYKQTPCFQHSQLEAKNTNCRLGEYLRKKYSNMKQYLEGVNEQIQNNQICMV